MRISDSKLDYTNCTNFFQPYGLNTSVRINRLVMSNERNVFIHLFRVPPNNLIHVLSKIWFSSISTLMQLFLECKTSVDL